jgi:uncharacterized protein with HEPN domain
VIAAELLAGLRRALDQLAGLAELGRDRYDADVLVRLAVQRLWISVGNYAEVYRLATGIATGTQPWSEMYGYRSVLAHMLPEEINDDRVWFETVEGVDRLRAELGNVSS